MLLEDPDFLILSLWVSDDFLSHCTGDDEADGAPRPAILQNVRNHWSLRLAQAFRQAGTVGASAMEIQTLAFALLRHLMRSEGRLSESGGLDPLALGRVLELMQDRLADNLTLTRACRRGGAGGQRFQPRLRQERGHLALPPFRRGPDAARQGAAGARELAARRDRGRNRLCRPGPFHRRFHPPYRLFAG